MLRRVDRYLWRELGPPFALALLAFLVFIALELVLSLSDTLFSRGAGAREMLVLLAYKLPHLLTLAIPAGVLLATFLALTRLATARELLAFQALGYSLRRLLTPFLLFGLAASVAAFLLAELAVPPAEAAYRRELLRILYRGEVTTPQEHVFFRGSQGALYYVEAYDGRSARGIMVYDLSSELFPNAGAFPALATARQGAFAGGELVLREGRVVRFTEDGGVEQVVRFDQLTLAVGEEVQQGLLGGKTPSEMSLRELAQRIDLFHRSGLDPRNLVVEFHAKAAVAAAAFVFALFGAPLGALLGWRGRAAGAVAGFLLAAGAQGLFVWTKSMARRGLLPASLGGWLPHMVLALLGIALLARVDRLRLRWRLLGLVCLVMGTAIAAWPAPPFQELRADELELQSGASVLRAAGVQARLPAHSLTADRLDGQETAAGWTLVAAGAELAGEGLELAAEELTVELDSAGALRTAAARAFSGSSTFQGPEKEETLQFAGGWGRAQFAGGDLARLEGSRVQFTTCPCLDGAPYAVHTRRFLLVPDRWLYAESVTVYAFDRPVGWLPVYAARLGEEAFPLFPEVGRRGGEWFLRWHLPWALGEALWGAVGLAWFPGSGRAQPTLDLLWEGGDLHLAEGEGRLSLAGEVPSGPWEATLRWQDTAAEGQAAGRLGAWEWALGWSRVEWEDGDYLRQPELVLARTASWLDGELAVQLSGGQYQVGGVAAARAGVDLAWRRQFQAGPVALSLPWQLVLDHYSTGGRAVLSASPRLELAGLEFAYAGRLRFGQSPFPFDEAPPKSQLSASLTARQEAVRQEVTVGWDLAAAAPLPGRWTLRAPGLSLAASFDVDPLAIRRVGGTASWRDGDRQLVVQTGIDLAQGEWEDLLIKGRWEGAEFAAAGGIRLVPWPMQVQGAALQGTLSLTEAWTLRGAVEYDAAGGRLVQLEAGMYRTLAGCLRLGLEADLEGIRITLEVPAFPQASVSFSPQDEGLRLGG
ncbi:MAG: LptF/LptG family permease [Candidatus Bipolaricaulaceae bacterium]